jgi:hypothetical protein
MLKNKNRIGADLQEEVKNVQQSPDILLHKPAGLLTDGSQSMAGWISGMSSLITTHV